MLSRSYPFFAFLVVLEASLLVTFLVHSTFCCLGKHPSLGVLEELGNLGLYQAS